MELIFLILAIALGGIRSSSRRSWRNNMFWDGSDMWGDTDDNSNNTFQDPLLTGIVVFIVIAFLLNPIVGVVLIPVGIFAYRQLQKKQKDQGAQRRRKEALLRARVFLLPYKDIWKNLTLSNKYCSLKLKLDGKTIVGTEKKTDPYLPYRTFRITASQVFDNNELWNLFCVNFSHNKSYEGLLEDCNRFQVSLYEDIITPQLPKPVQPTVVNGETVAQIDINNCSEAELTALPGISIVIAKKIIKKREEIGGFKNVADFLLFVKLKPNVSKQLEPKVCVNKMKGSLKIQRNSERTLDL